jgi:hypothetical protein
MPVYKGMRTNQKIRENAPAAALAALKEGYSFALAALKDGLYIPP